MEQESLHTQRLNAIKEKLNGGNSNVGYCIDALDNDSLSWILGLTDKQRAEMISFFDKVATSLNIIASHAQTDIRQSTTVGMSALASEIKSLLQV